ncbi:MAG: gluconokinase [Bacteroidota bacterium]
MSAPTVLVLMGVSGVGKTTVGQHLAACLGWAFADADALHPPENVAKMQRGEGLTDADRAPWLRAVRTLIDECIAAELPTVLACSALKRAYRDQLRRDDDCVAVVWLDAPHAALAERLARRPGHFAGPDLLPSQFAALEPPSPSEAVRVRSEGCAEDTAWEIVKMLGLRHGPRARHCP